jgi:hypothetical protein
MRSYVKAPVVIHVSRRWVSVKAFNTGVAPIARAMEALELGRVLFAWSSEPPVCGDRVYNAYRGYLLANMFWEAHVAGEEIWRRTGLRGRLLAALAGALAKAQEGAPEAAEKIIAKASVWARRIGLELDARAAAETAWRVYSSGWADMRQLGWLLELAASRR